MTQLTAKRFSIVAALKEIKQAVGPRHSVTIITGKPNYDIHHLEAIEHYHIKGISDPAVQKELSELKITGKLRKVGLKLHATAMINYSTLYDILIAKKKLDYKGVAVFSKKQQKAKVPTTDRQSFFPESKSLNNYVEVLLGYKFEPKEILIDLDAFYRDKQAQLALTNMERHIKLEHVPFGTKFGFTGAELTKDSPDEEVLIKGIKISKSSISSLYDPFKKKWVKIPKKLTADVLKEMVSLRS